MQIDFYILETTSGQKSLLFACQQIEKLHTEQKKRIYINMNSLDEAQRFDDLLWTFRDNSFLPHSLYDPSDDRPPPIQIGVDVAPINHQDILLNLSQKAPLFYSQFNHVIEIVFSDPAVQQWARQRFKHYRDEGHDINTIKLKVNET